MELPKGVGWAAVRIGTGEGRAGDGIRGNVWAWRRKRRREDGRRGRTERS